MGMKKIVKKLITKKNSEKSKLEKNQGGYEKKKGGCYSTYFCFDISRSASTIDIWRNVDIQNPRLSHHWVCIYLAHVLPSIFFLDIGNMQVEGRHKIP